MIKGKSHNTRMHTRTRPRGKVGKRARKKYAKAMRNANSNSMNRYHAFVTYGSDVSIYQQTRCGIYIKPSQNNIDWPWCDECQAELQESRSRWLTTTNAPVKVAPRMTKVISNSFHLLKYPEQMGDGDFKLGEWRQTACGVLVQFGRQSRHDPVCKDCSNKVQMPYKRRGKLVEAMTKKQSKARRRKIERIPEVTFVPTEETITLIQGELSNGVSA